MTVLYLDTEFNGHGGELGAIKYDVSLKRYVSTHSSPEQSPDTALKTRE